MAGMIFNNYPLLANGLVITLCIIMNNKNTIISLFLKEDIYVQKNSNS